MSARQPLALSLAGFQFTYRSSYFDWRLLHGIDIDNVIRLTDVQAVEDCLDTLQRGAFAAERDRLLPANCVQLFRLLQLAIEYCSHLRAAHALLLDCYNRAMVAAESWKSSARAYLDAGAIFLSESMALGSLNRAALDATDMAKQALEAADREYNVALDALEAEDSRARHFRFRKHRTEISWSTLHATDVDRLVSSLDVAALEALLPNLTFGSITNEDDEQLTPHHFGQLVPLAQAALDYVLWQANATGALLEQAMTGLQSCCSDIPMLTSATQEMHANITSLLLGTQAAGGAMMGSTTLLGLPSGGGSGNPVGGGLGGSADMGYSGGGGGGGGALGLVTTANGPPAPWATGSVDLGQPLAQYGSGRLGTPQPLVRSSSPPAVRPMSGGPGGAPQVLRLGSGGPGGSRLGYGGSAATPYLPTYGSRALSGSLASGNMDELIMAAGGAPPGTAAFPVLELHSRTAELSYKVESIEQDLRLERSKTEEMRRILADIRDRLNQRPGTAAGGHGGGSALGGLSPAESLTFPAAAATLGSGMAPSPAVQGSTLTSGSAFLNAPMAVSAAGVSGSGGGMPGGLGTGLPSRGGTGGGSSSELVGRYGSAAGVNVSSPGDQGGGGGKIRVMLDEEAIREQERQRAVQVLERQAEKLRQQVLQDHRERRQITAAVALSASQQLAQLSGSGSGIPGMGRLQDAGGPKHSRQPSRDGRRIPRRSSPSKGGRPASSGSTHHASRHGHMPSYDYSSDMDLAMFIHGSGGSYDVLRPSSSRKVSAGGAAGSGGGGHAKPPKPLSRLSSPMTMHGSLGDLPSAAAVYGGGPGSGGGGGGAASRLGQQAGHGHRSGGGGAGRAYGLSDSAEDAMPLPPPQLVGSISVDSTAGPPSRGGPGPAAAGPRPRSPAGVPAVARVAAASPFGSISLVGPDKEAEAANVAAAAAAAGGGSGYVSKASSFSDRVTSGSRYSTPAGLEAAYGRPAGGGGGGAGGSGGGSWDAAGAVAASLR